MHLLFPSKSLLVQMTRNLLKIQQQMIYWIMNLWILELIKNNISASVAADKLDITLNRDFKEDQHIVPSQDDTVQNPLVLSSGEASADREMNPGALGELELSPRIAVGQPGDDSYPG
ncbi:unnamed protein product [Lathyrus sativus]|nr:unnamed protein product [Lathyrus sativus]